ncbi:MAG TPA: GNAT family N-acetyltransferase [Terriglobia bacterium]|nr:GNAT family N-acetyltransferase [Terriglobia bacterium]
MEISIREWKKDDLFKIEVTWLEYCRTAARSDMRLKPDAETAMAQWLMGRFKQPSSIGYIAEENRTFGGFLIGRVDDWESVPPVIQPRRIGIIDAVYVNEDLRRQGIASRLIQRAVQTMQDANVVAIETIFDAWNDASGQTWRRARFEPWMVHAYRML